MAKTIKVCPICGKEFEANRTTQKYCCKECSKIAAYTMYKKVCPICGKTFASNRIDRTYCSRKCWDKSRCSENTYIFKDDYIELTIASGKFDNKKVLIDIDDYEKIKKYTWHLVPGKMKNYTVFYAVATIDGGKSKGLRMHRYITNCPDGMVVDHINHNGLDNRKSNLRICTPQQNQLNKIPTTEYPGIKTEIYYRYVVVHRGKYLGTYKRFEDAYKTKKTAEALDPDKEFFYEKST